MARTSNSQPVVRSILDRLLDDNPDGERDPRPSPGQQLSQLRESVRRDLENLLNTRRRHLSWPEALSELELSLVGYGIPDFTGISLSGMNSREEFRRIIESTLRRYETRFKSVRVELLNNREIEDRTMRLRISATLHAEPTPEPLQFDTTLEPVHHVIKVNRTS